MFKIISKDFPVANMEETGLNGYVYNVLADFYSNTVINIFHIHKYLMKKHDIK